jgi:hypothetical protein
MSPRNSSYFLVG